jgi:hypothetical protein
MVIKLSGQIGLKKGDKGEEVEILQKTLQKFGYIQPEEEALFGAKIDKRRSVERPPESDRFDERTENALKLFQNYYKLKPTGMLDRQTVYLLNTPRCGVPDILEGGQGPEEFNLFGEKWDNTDLTYHFENFTPDMPRSAIKQAFRLAFAQWSSVSPLTFTEMQSNGDFNIRWASGEHGDGRNNAFDGPSQTLAHCFFPKTNFPGRLCCDEAEAWSTDNPPSGIDLPTVAIHELGHGLGIRHSDDRNAIMYAYYGGIARTLKTDDIKAIQFLYGEP